MCGIHCNTTEDTKLSSLEGESILVRRINPVFGVGKAKATLGRAKGSTEFNAATKPSHNLSKPNESNFQRGNSYLLLLVCTSVVDRKGERFPEGERISKP